MLIQQELWSEWRWTEHNNIRWLNEPPLDSAEARELAFLNPLLDVSPEDELYHGDGKSVETFDSHLAILVHIPEYAERRLPKDK